MDFAPVTTRGGIEKLAGIASAIWHEYWPSLIGSAQTDYMVNRFQSDEALARDIHEKGYLYFLLVDEGEVVGYTGAHPEEENEKLFISKIYLYAACRGRGYASKVLRFYETYCKENGLGALYLTVNKDNDLAIKAYLAKGFVTIDAVETDIGDGFIMDDYIMEKVL